MMMKKSTLVLTTALCLMAATPAFAEDMSNVDPNCITKNSDGTPTVDMAKCPDGKTMATPSGPSMAEPDTQAKSDSNANDMTTDKTMTGSDAAASDQPLSSAVAPSVSEVNSDQTASKPEMDKSTEAKAAPASPTDSALIVPADQMSGATIMSANDYIGKRVYDRAGNDIGEVNDLIISDDGKIQATVLGVGGFLGLGEKDVAVSVSSVEMVKDGDGVKLVVDATKEQLEKAPTFDPAIRNYAG